MNTYNDVPRKYTVGHLPFFLRDIYHMLVLDCKISFSCYKSHEKNLSCRKNIINIQHLLGIQMNNMDISLVDVIPLIMWHQGII